MALHMSRTVVTEGTHEQACTDLVYNWVSNGPQPYNAHKTKARHLKLTDQSGRCGPQDPVLDFESRTGSHLPVIWRSDDDVSYDAHQGSNCSKMTSFVQDYSDIQIGEPD